MAVDEQLTGIDASLLNEVVPSCVGVFVDLDLRRESAITLAIPAVVDGKDVQSQSIKPCEAFDVAADIKIIAVEVEECRAPRIAGFEPPPVQQRGIATDG